MSQDDQPAMGSPKLPKLHCGVFSSVPREIDFLATTGRPSPLVDCIAAAGSSDPPPVTPSPDGGVGIGGYWMSRLPKDTSINHKRSDFDGSHKTPSPSLLHSTASSTGYRVAEVTNSTDFQYSACGFQGSSLKVRPNNKGVCSSNTQQCIDNNEINEVNRAMIDSSFKQQQHPALDPFCNVNIEDIEQYRSHNDTDEKYLSFADNENIHSPTKRPLEHSPFPTPLYRRQSEPMLKTVKNDTLRSQVFDPVASQLLDQDEVFVSVSSVDDIMDSETTQSTETDGDRNHVRYNSMPNLLTSPDSPMPMFRKVSGSLQDVKTKNDLNLLARPIPRKL